MKLPNVFKILGTLGVAEEDLVRVVLHHLTQRLAEAPLRQALGKISPAGLQKLGRRCRAVGDQLMQAEPDRAGAAKELAGILGDIKL